MNFFQKEKLIRGEDCLETPKGGCSECDAPIGLLGNPICQTCFSQEKANQYYLGAAHTRDALKKALEKHSCITCKHSSWMEDASVGIPLHMEDCAYITEEICEQLHNISEDEAYTKTASLCGHWELDPDNVGPMW